MQEVVVKTDQPNICYLPLEAEDIPVKLAATTEVFDFFNDDHKSLQIKNLQQYNSQLEKKLEKTINQKHSEVKEKAKVAHRLATLLDLLPGGVIVLDRSGVVSECNPAAIDLLGDPLKGARWLTIIERCFSPRNDDGHEISLKDGRRVALSTRSMGGDDGQIILLIDQTETRQLLEKVSRNQRLTAMGQMVSALAHQIRTPLSAAMLYAGNLCRAGLSDEKYDRFALKLMSRLNDMEEQIRDMLVFAKGDLPLTDRINALQLMEDIQQAMEVPLLSNAGVCHWTAPSRAILQRVSIFCNRQALVGAVSNLINNGIQSVEPGQSPCLDIKIAIHQDDKISTLTLDVTDNGRGMNAAQLEAIEDAFYSTKPSGTGLGLFVVQAITKAHQGQFRIKSVLNCGTTASIRLPCAI